MAEQGSKELENNIKLIKTRDEAQKERDEAILVNLYFQQWPITKMSEELQRRNGEDYRVSYLMIRKTLETAIDKWKEAKIIEIDARKNVELAKLDAIEAEYWQGWRRSLRPHWEKTKKEATGVGATGPVEIDTETIKEYERDGDPKWIEGVERCIWKRCQLLDKKNL